MKKRFKIIAVITSLMLALGMSITAFAGFDDFLPPDPPDTRQAARLERVSAEAVRFVPGDAKEISVHVRNIGDRAATDVRVSAGVGAGNPPIVFELNRDSERLWNMSPNADRSIALSVRALPTAEAGRYPITMTLTYRDHSNAIQTTNITVFIQVDVETNAPELIVRDFSVGGDGVRIGDDFNLTAILQNVGGANARDVQVLIDGFSATGIFLSGASNNLFFPSLSAAATQTMNFSLSTHRDIRSGSYPLTFTLRWRDENNKTGEREFIYFVNVQGTASATDRATLEISQMTVPPGTFNVAQEFRIAFTLTNTGIEEARNVRVTAKPESTAIRPRSASVRSITRLPSGEATRLEFVFAPSEDAATQNYSIGFEVSYETGIETDDNRPETTAFEQFVGVNVYNPDKDDDEGGIFPRIIIDSYTVDPIVVRAGEEFDLRMTFRNTHATMSIANIKATLTPQEVTTNGASSSAPFMPVDGSNTFFIDHIPPRGTAAKDFRMFTIPNADPRAYTIRVDFEYQDSDYTERTASEIIGITVRQITRLDTGNIMVPTEGFMFQPMFVNFNLMNTGRAALHNLTVEIVGEGFETTKSFMYFGTINRSASAFYDGEITPQMPGSQPGQIIITFEDEVGEVTTVTRDFVMEVMDMGGGGGFDDWPMDFPPDRFDGGGGGFDFMSLVRNPLVWVGVVALCVAGFFGKRYYDKKRRPQYDDE